MRLLIKNGRVIDPKENIDKELDILVEDGIIIDKSENIKAKADKVIDARGKWVVPGLIDVHVHLRDPGFTYKEDIESGSRAAAKGGFTTICPMPNTSPTIDNKDLVKYIKDKEGLVNILPVGAISKNLDGQELTNLEEMQKVGICAISDDGKSVMNSKILKESMKNAASLKLPMMSHCEDINLAGGSMNEGDISKELGLSGLGKDAEEIITARDIILAKYTGVKLHICHVSTKMSVDLIRFAKERGIDVTAEVAPHHFILTEEEVKRSGTKAKMSPPLRTKEDIDAIKKGLVDGTIEIIATDHAPHHEDEKDVDFEEAAFGIVGLETSFGLSYTYLVETGLLTPLDLISKMSLNPARLLGIDKGSLGVGKKADITVIDPDKEYKVDVENFLSKSKNTPFNNYKLKGLVENTIVSGQIIYTYKGEK